MRTITLLAKMAALSLGIALAGVAVVRADEPTPAPVPIPAAETPLIVAPKEVTGTGKRSDPFVFDVGTKCYLRLTGSTAKADWDLEDAPPDAEAFERLLIFSLAVPGDYVVWVNWTDGSAKAWFRVKGANGPPAPVDEITRRVRDAFSGPDGKADAVKFRAACEGLAAALEAGKVTRLLQMEAALKAGLDAVGWQQGKYPDLSNLAGELWGADVPDGAIDTATKAKFIGQLKAICTACQGVK